MEFRWNDWNLDHIAKHGIAADEVEFIVAGVRQPYPETKADGKRLVIGKTFGGDLIQVIYVLDDPTTIYVIHARPLTDPEKRRYRRRIR